MLLKSLELVDFRSFYGDHLLQFSSENERRVTIFYGENGAGKTNLLNAIHWCLTGKFTPRFRESGALVNKQALEEGRRTCSVELTFLYDVGGGLKEYRARRTGSNDKQTTCEVFEVEHGNSKTVPKGEALLRRVIPPGLVSWFFFDAEAIGALELSGSESFRQDLRKTLGFELVDKLLEDLKAVKAKRQREVTVSTNDKELAEIQQRIDNLDRVLPGHKQELIKLTEQYNKAKAEYDDVRSQLEGLPQSRELEKQRSKLEGQIADERRRKQAQEQRAAQTVGASAPAMLVAELTNNLEEVLQQQEVTGKLPSPYSDQLVKDILESESCICGRPVPPNTEYAVKIKDLMKFASTGELNQRIASVRYLIRDIERQAEDFPISITQLRSNIGEIDVNIGRLEDEKRSTDRQLADIDVAAIKALELKRAKLEDEWERLIKKIGAQEKLINDCNRNKDELQQRYESVSKKLSVNQRFKTELDKTNRLINFIENSLQEQEHQSLRILAIELNRMLERYLTKHYTAKIDSQTYAVHLLDDQNRKVGHSTGEGQVLKFAFIATIVALAAKKTQLKVQWLADPTVAPLVLDAPFSALDTEYQAAVAENLALQATQLVLMISSAAWGQRVAAALDSLVGTRYLIISKEPGPQGLKPIKRIEILGTEYELNEFGSERAESCFVEVQ
jgi:DNA sulfur modification protein DndD